MGVTKMSAIASSSLQQFEGQVAAAFRNAVRKTPLQFAGAIVPFKSPIDKAAAFAVMSMQCAEEPVWLHVCKTTTFGDEKIAEWEKKGICCIDLGSRKYHGQNGSATEWVIGRYSLPRSEGIQKLIEVINKNNRTGYLKSFKGAVAHTMREMYELEKNTADWWSVKVLSRAADIVTAFVRVENGEIFNRTQMPDQIAQLVAQFGDTDKPLTLGQYASNLWVLGEESEAIQEKLEFWQTGLKRLAEAKRVAKLCVAKEKLNSFYVGNLPGVLLEKRDHFFMKEVLRAHKFAIRIIVDDSGHAAISTNKLDCSTLYRHLNLREPGRWHHNEQMGALINGGPQYTETVATDVPPKKLVEMVQYYLAPKKKN